MNLKNLGIAAATVAMLLAFIGAGTASATTLTGEGGAVLKAGSTIHAANRGTVQLTGGFKNIECEESTIVDKTTNETGTVIGGNVESLTLSRCNCEVNVLKKGSLSITKASNDSGFLTSSGLEITVTCSTIFGKVHCIYVSNITELGSLRGSGITGATATMLISGGGGAHLTPTGTDLLCSEEAVLHVEYVIDSPDVLNLIS